MPKPTPAYKKGRQTLGGIFELSDGTKVFLSFQWHRDIYKGKHPTISDAANAGEAGWAIDTDILRKAKREGATVVGVFERDSGDMYVTSMDRYFTEGEYTQISWSQWHKQARRSIPMQVFSVKRRPPRLR